MEGSWNVLVCNSPRLGTLLLSRVGDLFPPKEVFSFVGASVASLLKPQKKAGSGMMNGAPKQSSTGIAPQAAKR